MRSLICVCLVALLVLLCVGVWAVFETARTVQVIGSMVRTMPELLDRHAERAVAAAVGELRATRMELKGEVGETRREVLRRVDAIEGLVDAHAIRIEDSAVGEIRAARADVMQAVRPVAGEAEDLIATYRRLPADVGARLGPWTDCKGNGACWQAQITAALGATRSAIGQVAMSAPRVAASVERSAAASEKATVATAAAMTNIAEVTKPLPRYLRIPLQIMGPTAPLWLPFAVR